MTDPEAQAATKAMFRSAFSDAAATYDQVIDFFAPFGRALVAAADIERGTRVLDVACGRGACTFPALDAVGPTGSVLGIDLAEGMVDELNRTLAARGVGNAEARVGDVEHLDLPDGWFDVAIGGFMIFFPPDPPRALRELHRVLRPGGTLALSIFDGPSGFPWIDDVAKELLGDAPRPSASEFNRAVVLDDALVSAGFRRPDAIEVQERFRFEDLEHVEAWLRSHGARILLSVLDDAGLARFRVLAQERLDAEHRAPDGEGYELVQSARMTVARRP